MTGGGPDPSAPDERGQSVPGDEDETLVRFFSGETPLRGAELRRVMRESGDENDPGLQECASALEFLDEVVGDAVADLPETLGDYRILGVLGRGGMGTVFEAYQESLERVVALKVLSPHLTGDPRMRKRFRTEAKANATLHHQHIVPVFGYGEASGYLYFAMERVDGISLDKHIANGRRRTEPLLEPKDAAARFAGVADALHHAHRRGILHRDVKPGNVLVHPDGSLALADFGLSKIVGEQSQSLSRAGGFLGTLQYAAPEQALGRDPDESSDLYSLGVTLFEVLTGRRPLEGDSTEAILHALANHEPVPLRRVLPGASKDLQAVMERLLAKNPRDRYSDGEAVARDLRGIAEDTAVMARRSTLASRAWRRIKRHPGLSSAVALASILLVTVLVLGLQVTKDKAQRGFEDRLVEIAAEIQSGPGDFAGPSASLLLLIGSEGFDVTSLTERSREAVATLAGVQERRPEDPRPTDWSRAIAAEQQEGEWARMLRKQGAPAALGYLDAEIERLQPDFAQLERTAVLELYRLYFARAVLKLCESIGDPTGAENDILRASFLRPGAIAPKLLRAVLEWDRKDPVALVDVCQDLCGGLGDDAERMTRELLGCVIGVGRAVDARMMDFGVLPQLSIYIAEQLEDRFPPLEPISERTEEGPVARQLRVLGEQLARLALNDANQRQLLRIEADRTLKELIVTGSDLNAWSMVYDRLLDSNAPIDPELSLAQRLRAWELLVDLLTGQRARLLDLRDAVDSELLTLEVVDPLRALRLRARIEIEIADPYSLKTRLSRSEFERIDEILTEWIVRDESDPEARLAVLRLMLRRIESTASTEHQSELERVGFNALEAIDRSAAMDSYAPRVRQRMERTIARLKTGSSAVRLQRMVDSLFSG